MNHDFRNYICRDNYSIIDAMRIIDSNAVGLVYVVDGSQKLTGCLTDGDIRRFIIHTGKLDAMVREVMNCEPKFIFNKEVSNAKKKMEDELVYSLAVVDNYGFIVDVIFHEKYLDFKEIRNSCPEATSGTPAIVMAGGKGTRLYPYTRILPKPLIPIGDVPIVERILNRLSSYGIDDIWLTVNYKKEMIKLYFSEVDHPYRLHFVDEDKPLGTAGSISLIKETFDRPVIITNCDVLIEVDYGKVMEHHMSSCNDLTVISSLKNTVIPYGVLHSGENGIITEMEEKPQLSHLINTGMYIINPEFLKWIPNNQAFHMTQLVELMIKRSKRVGMYPVSERSFLDMGEFEELKKMEERLRV